MVNVNVTENASTLVADSNGNEVSEASTAAVSVISLNMTYEFQNYVQKSYFLKATAPLISSDGSGMFLGGIGANWYFNSLSSLFSFDDQGSNMTISPTSRYYLGGFAGVGYLVYITDTAKKSDLLFELGLHGGAIFNFKKDWGLRAELGLGRGTGVATSTIGIKAFVGVNYYIDE